VRGASADKGPTKKLHNGTQLIFVAGAEGTGHHFITALMMRVPSLMPMTLVQEQTFRVWSRQVVSSLVLVVGSNVLTWPLQALWWKPTARDPRVFWSALEAFSEWVRTARSLNKHPAFCAVPGQRPNPPQRKIRITEPL